MNDNNEKNNSNDIAGEVEAFLAQGFKLQDAAESKAYADRVHEDRSRVVKTLVDEGLLDNEDDYVESDGALLLLDADDKLTHPITELIANRYEIHGAFVNEQAQALRLAQTSTDPVEKQKHASSAETARFMSEEYFADYTVLTLVCKYVHGLRNPSDTAKKHEQVVIIQSTDETSAMQIITRRKILATLDILMPGGGFDVNAPLSETDKAELDEMVKDQREGDIDRQLKERLNYGLLHWSADDESGMVDPPFITYRNHDDFSDFAHLVSMVATDAEGELEELFRGDIDLLADRIGINNEEVWLQILALQNRAVQLREEVLGDDSSER